MKNKPSKNEKFIAYLYLLGMFAMCSIVLLVMAGRVKKGESIISETYKDISACWTLDEGGKQPVVLRQLGAYMDEDKGVLSMYYQLPELHSDVSLVYRSKDVYTKVLVDEEVIYETSVYECDLYNKSPGNLWNVLNINSKYSEKCLELQISMVYDTSAVTVDSLLLGDKADIILGLFADNISGIVISMLLVLLGCVLVVVDLLPSYGRSKKHHGLFWVGSYAFFAGLWSLIETNMVQFCVDDMRILQLLDNMLMMVPTVPLVLYLNTEYKILKNKFVSILSYMGGGYILLSALVQYKGTHDLHDMLNGGLYIMMLTDLVLCVWLFVKLISLKKEKKPLLDCVLMFIGVFASCACTIFETIRSLNEDRMDRAGLIRVGMLILCICFAAASQIDTYKIVEQGLKYDLVRKLAYSDGLTGLGNRTAYLEQLEAYEKNSKEKIQLGVVFLDVNNLKKVNDKYGHECGDELIRSAAKIIEESFGKFGKSYRVGGDEFCVLIASMNPKEQYEEALALFYEEEVDANSEITQNFEVQIAHGFALCQELSKEYIDAAIALADSEMYQDKARLKKQSSAV